MGGGGSRPGYGRKPIKASLKRSVLLFFNARPSEDRQYRRAARAQGLKLAAWIRKVLNRACSRLQ